MSAYPTVKVVGAPGFEDFEGDLIMEVARADGVPLSIVGDPETMEFWVFKSKYVQR